MNKLGTTAPESDYSRLQAMSPENIFELFYEKSQSKNLAHICYEIIEAGCSEKAVFLAINKFKVLATMNPHAKESLQDFKHHIGRLTDKYKLTHDGMDERQAFPHAILYVIMGSDYLEGFAEDERQEIKSALDHYIKEGEAPKGMHFFGRSLQSIILRSNEEVVKVLK